MKIDNIDIHNYPGSEKIYIEGTLHDIRVPMRRIKLTPTVKSINGESVVMENQPVCVYDTDRKSVV